MKHRINQRILTLAAALCLLSPALQAEEKAPDYQKMVAVELASRYKIDPAHTFVQFRISHLGFSVLNGRFNEMDGYFVYNPDNPEGAGIQMTVKTASVDSNHAERDKHLRGKDFLDTDKFPEAEFSTTAYEEDGTVGTLKGDLNLHGVTRPIVIHVVHVGDGKDPWGGYRRGFKGNTSIKLKDFGIDYDLGPASEDLLLDIYIEGVREE